MTRVFSAIIGYFWLALLVSPTCSAQDETIVPKTYLVAVEADDVAARVLFNAAAYYFDINVRFVTYSSFDSMFLIKASSLLRERA